MRSVLGEKQLFVSDREEKVSTTEGRFKKQVCTSVESCLLFWYYSRASHFSYRSLVLLSHVR